MSGLDTTISVAQYLLSKQLRIVKWFKEIIVGKLQQFLLQKHRSKQIIYDNRPWVTIYINSYSDKSVVHIFDSLQKLKISTLVQQERMVSLVWCVL